MWSTQLQSKCQLLTLLSQGRLLHCTSTNTHPTAGSLKPPICSTPNQLKVRSTRHCFSYQAVYRTKIESTTPRHKAALGSLRQPKSPPATPIPPHHNTTSELVQGPLPQPAQRHHHPLRLTQHTLPQAASPQQAARGSGGRRGTAAGVSSKLARARACAAREGRRGRQWPSAPARACRGVGGMCGKAGVRCARGGCGGGGGRDDKDLEEGKS